MSERESNPSLTLSDKNGESGRRNWSFVIFTPLLPSRHPAGLLSALAGGHRLAARLGIPWSVDRNGAPPLLPTDPLVVRKENE